MTALNVFVDDDRVHLSTDGLGIYPNGRVAGYLNKVDVLPHLHAVVASRTTEPILRMIPRILSKSSSFDDMIDKLPNILGRVAMLWEFETVIAGWSTRQDAVVAYRASSVRQFSRAVSVAKIEGAMFAPFDEGLSERCAQKGVRIDMPINPEWDAWIIMNEQRVPHSGAFMRRPGIAVGGYCQLTTITREQITTSVVGRWPDTIGEPIAP